MVGRWYYLYLILDLYSSKVIGWEVYAEDDADHASHLVRRTALGYRVPYFRRHVSNFIVMSQTIMACFRDYWQRTAAPIASNLIFLCRT